VILLDTHVLLWYLAGDTALPKSLQQEIYETPQVYVSAASVWELGIKGRIKGTALHYGGGRTVDSSAAVARLVSTCEGRGIEFLDISVEACSIAPFLPGPHKDPFDRIIAAQSVVPRRLTLISADTAFDSFAPEVMRYWPQSPGKKRPKRTP
jgi:PIN domain nuclease of toxin-antitoxin system